MRGRRRRSTRTSPKRRASRSDVDGARVALRSSSIAIVCARSLANLARQRDQVHAAAAAGSIDRRACGRHGDVVVEVRDTGIGIPPRRAAAHLGAALPRRRQPLRTRARPRPEPRQGHRRGARRHALRVESTPGVGTIFGSRCRSRKRSGRSGRRAGKDRSCPTYSTDRPTPRDPTARPPDLPALPFTVVMFRQRTRHRALAILEISTVSLSPAQRGRDRAKDEEKERLMNTTVRQQFAAWRQRRRRAAAAVAAASALLLTGSLVGWSAHAAATDVSGHPALAAPAAAVVAQAAGAPRDSYAPLVAKVAPAVVTVRSERRVRAAQQFPFRTIRRSASSSATGSAGPLGPEAAAARARLRRHRPPRRLHPHQPPRRRRRRAGHRRADRSADASRRRSSDPTRPSDLAVLKVDGDEPADAGARQLRAGARRRRRARGRQPARRRPDRDDGHRQREGPRDGPERRQLRGLHPDRRADQPGQLGRRAGQHARRADRDQLADPLAVRRQHRHRLRDSREHGAQRHDAADRHAARCGAACSA